MRKHWATLLGALVLSLAVTEIPAAAKIKRHSITLYHPAEVNGVTLKPGKYNVALVGDSVVFYQGSKEVAKAPGRAEVNGATHAGNSVVYDSEMRSLLEVRPAGSNTKLVLDNSTAARVVTGGTSKAVPQNP